jgi:hypothetical protein
MELSISLSCCLPHEEADAGDKKSSGLLETATLDDRWSLV